MTTSLYAPVTSPGDVSAKNYTSLYSDSLTPAPNPSGDVTIQGNLTVKGGNIYTTATTASVFPTNATTVNAFTAATSLFLGANTGWTTINNDLAIDGSWIRLRANTTGTPPPAPTGEAGIVVNRGSTGQDAYIIWAETGNFNTGYWDLNSDVQVQGDLRTKDFAFIGGNQIIGNATQTSPVDDFYLIARRGLPTYPDVSLKWNEATNHWQFTNDGSTFYDMVASGSSGSATFGNITIAVADANTITTTSGALKLKSAIGSIDATNNDLTAENLYANNSIISYGYLAANGNVIYLNNEDGTLSSNAGLLVKRGVGNPFVSVRWNYTTNKWQFTNDGTTFYNIVGSDAVTGDVNVTGKLIADGVVGTNGNYIAFNYDNTALTSNVGLIVNRGVGNPIVAVRWNYTTNRWQFTNDGSNFYDMVSSLDDLSDVVITSPTNAQFLTYDGTDWVNSNTTTATSVSQTLQLKRSGAFSADLPDTPKGAIRLVKKFTDIATAPYDHGGPGILLNVEDSTGTQYAFAAITSNYDSGGDNAIALISSSDGFTSLHENAVFGALTSTINSDPTINGDLQVNGTSNLNGSVTVASGNLNVTSGNIIATSSTAILSAINLDSRVLKNTSTATYTTTSQQVFGNVPIATYRTVKYVWQISRGTEFQSVETLITHNGTNAFMTTYADLRTGNNLANFDVDISGSNMRILVTPTSATSTVFVADYTLFNV